MKGPFLHRPRLHFTPQSGYLNDPNGLVYDARAGIYHVCFQYQRDVRCDLNVCWRHAQGTDLCALREGEIVIFPDERGVAFSGCSVLDEENVSGLFAQDSAKILSFYTAHDLCTKHESVAAAYSDDGKCWKTLARPILENRGDEYGVNGFRDPKVFRYPGTDTWLMIIGGGKARLFASRNLLDWEFQSEVQNVCARDPAIVRQLLVLQRYLPDNDPFAPSLYTECPDLFPLSAENGEQKWVLSGGGLFYIVGDLRLEDGKYTFVPQGPRQTFVRCSDFFVHRGEPYAMQTFAGELNGRRVALFWLMDDSAREIAGKPYNGALSLPHELRLTRENGAYFVSAYPVKELEALRIPVACRENLRGSDTLAPQMGALWDLSLQFDCDKTDAFTLMLYNEKNRLRFLFRPEERALHIDLTHADETLRHTVKTLRLERCNEVRIVKDVSVLDVYVNEGRQWYSVFTFHEKDEFAVSLVADGPNTMIRKVEVYALRPVYGEA